MNYYSSKTVLNQKTLLSNQNISYLSPHYFKPIVYENYLTLKNVLQNTFKEVKKN